MKKENGITLVALVISIIVLLILATVTIQTLTGNNGLLTKAETAVQSNKDSQELEKIQLAVLSAQMKNKNLSEEILNTELQETFNNDKTVIESLNYYIYKTDKSYRIYKDGKVEEGNLLPDEFKQVEYIESTGTQYIDTRNETTTNNKTEFILEFDANNSNGWTGVNGSMQLQITGNAQKKEYKVIYYGNIGKQEIYIDNILNKTNNWGIGNWLGRIYVGKLYKTNGNENGISGYIYNLRVIENDSIVKNFIPCYNTTTVTDVDEKECLIGTAGLYDTVEGKFYTNQGTGEFIAGPEV